MKKLFYPLALLFFAVGMSANNDPSLWDAVNGEKAAKFDTWLEVKNAEGEVVNIRPFGWYTGTPYFGATIKLEPTTDRNGVANSACRADVFDMTATWGTWHNQMKANYNSSQEDYNPVFIDKGTSFYYTFWAKAEEEGMKIHIGPEQLWNPDNFVPKDVDAWLRMPSVELTTKWTKYGILISSRDAFMDAIYFNIHFRSNGVRYIDDIELRVGEELPGDVGTEVGIFEWATDNDPITIISSQNGIGFTSMGGLVSVYNSMGMQVAQREVNEGTDFIQLETKGLHIIKYTKDAQKAAVKVLVQ